MRAHTASVWLTPERRRGGCQLWVLSCSDALEEGGNFREVSRMCAYIGWPYMYIDDMAMRWQTS